MFTSILNSAAADMTIENAVLCTAVSLVLGLFIAVIYMSQGSYSNSFVMTLVILPALV